ncbi:hypothetical protein [Ktedonospora formicarum]|uniref:Uncharacterized protein n=1 Tax=Ktedonospora formicarum TaxID=2778364 RepID=A0A8J3IE11_9CHLR|nr:hypothetical protein [Ktedonospora formicarum]GHO49584.1 hypothetical protein KSX_77470 [Ktedonospora formicarum]
MTEPTTATSGNSEDLPQEVLDLLYHSGTPQGIEQEAVDWYNNDLLEAASSLPRQAAVRVARVIKKATSGEAFEVHSGGEPYDVWAFHIRDSLLELFDGDDESNRLVSILELLDARDSGLFIEHRMDGPFTQGYYLLLSENPALANRIVTLLAQTSGYVRNAVGLRLYGASSSDAALVRHGYKVARSSDQIEKMLETFEAIMAWEPKRSETRDAVLLRVSRDMPLLERVTNELKTLDQAQRVKYLDALRRSLGLS